MRYFFLTLSVILVFAACSPTPTVTPNRENIMRSKNWKLSGGTITVTLPNGKDTVLQYGNYVPDCYKDDYLSFDSMRRGVVHTGGVSCNAADPASRTFTWQLRNNETSVDLYDGFNTIFGAGITIEPYHFDTLQQSPLVLDSLVRTIDTTPGFLKQFIVLDTIRELRFTSYPMPYYDIYGASITDFSAGSFKVHFSLKTVRPDSTLWHAGAPNNFPPIVRPDTVHYSLTYSSF